MRAFSSLVAASAALALLGASPGGAAAQAADTGDAAASAARVSQAYMQMRGEALTTGPEELQFERRRPRVWGAIMELGLSTGGVATLVVFADGTTSLYSSAGGGIVGAGPQRDVRHASDAFLRAAAAHERMSAAAADHPLPAPGRVRFYLRTNAAALGAEAGEDELKAGGHPLSALYTAGQAVLAEVRPLSEYTP